MSACWTTQTPVPTRSKPTHRYTPSGSETILVAWTNDDTEHTLVLEATQADRVKKWGDRTTVSDRDDGIVDDLVSIVLEPSPVYVRYATEPGQ